MITSRQYRYLTDFTTVYDFLIDIYERATGATVSLRRFWNMPCPLPRWTNGICTATAFGSMTIRQPPLSLRKVNLSTYSSAFGRVTSPWLKKWSPMQKII